MLHATVVPHSVQVFFPSKKGFPGPLVHCDCEQKIATKSLVYTSRHRLNERRSNHVICRLIFATWPFNIDVSQSVAPVRLPVMARSQNE